MITSIGVICHEFGHILGLPDLYDTNGGSEGIGEWDLMASGNWNNLGRTPSSLSAWCKTYLGWQSPENITNPDVLHVLNSSQNNISYQINTPNSNEYFLLENRQNIGFDAALPGSGLCIWHINTDKTSSSHIENNDVNADENLKGVDLEEADGDNDMDNQTNRGDDGDLFPGTECNRTFNDNSNPNSLTYNPITNTSKPITQIIEDDNIISFNYNGYGPILGNDQVCGTGSTFELTNVPTTQVTINWTESNNLSALSGQGTQYYTVKAKINAASSGWVQAIYNLNCGNVVSYRDLDWVGVPYVNPGSIHFECVDGSGYFCTNAFGNEFSFTFDHQFNYFDIKLTNLSETQTFAQFRIYGTWGTMDCSPPEGTYLFQVRGNNDCGTATNWTKKAVDFVDCGMGGLFSLDIYTQGQLLKHSVPAIIDNKYVLNTSGWKQGMYFIRAYYKDEVVFGTLVVNK